MRGLTRRALAGLMLLFLSAGPVLAHEGRIVDLETAPPDHQVRAVGYCGGAYEVTLRDGSTRRFREFDLRFKTDSSPNGPRPGRPVLISAGMAGDRAFLVFSAPDEMTTFLKKAC